MNLRFFLSNVVCLLLLLPSNNLLIPFQFPKYLFLFDKSYIEVYFSITNTSYYSWCHLVKSIKQKGLSFRNKMFNIFFHGSNIDACIFLLSFEMHSFGFNSNVY